MSVLSVIKKIFSRKEPVLIKDNDLSFQLMMQLEETRRKNIDKAAQRSEDRRFKEDIELEAMDGLEQYLKNGKYCIVVPKPRRFTYTIHDEKTAMFKNFNYGAAVSKRLIELIKEHKQKSNIYRQ